jgi:outer membrane protein
MTQLRTLTTLALAASFIALAGGAQAQAAGDLTLRAGATTITPHTSSGDLSAPSLAGTKVAVGSASQLSGGITWMYSDAFGIDLPLALPFKHELTGDGAIAGVGKIGTVKALPITLLGQYRFLGAKAAARPYLGAGLTYARFFDTESTAALTALTGGSPSSPTTLSVKSKLAPTAELGVGVALGGAWSLDLSYTKTLLKTRATLSTGQTIDIKLDPSSVSLGLAFRY